MNERTGNLSVIFFVALLLSELNGSKHEHTREVKGHSPWENLNIRSSNWKCI